MAAIFWINCSTRKPLHQFLIECTEILFLVLGFQCFQKWQLVFRAKWITITWIWIGNVCCIRYGIEWIFVFHLLSCGVERFLEDAVVYALLLFQLSEIIVWLLMLLSVFIQYLDFGLSYFVYGAVVLWFFCFEGWRCRFLCTADAFASAVECFLHDITVKAWFFIGCWFGHGIRIFFYGAIAQSSDIMYVRWRRFEILTVFLEAWGDSARTRRTVLQSQFAQQPMLYRNLIHLKNIGRSQQPPLNLDNRSRTVLVINDRKLFHLQLRVNLIRFQRLLDLFLVDDFT